MADQAHHPESDGEHSEWPDAYPGNPVSVLAACRSAGRARGLDEAGNPLYAALLAVAHRLDQPLAESTTIAGLSSEFRQYVKQLGLDKNLESEKKEDNVLTALQGRFTKPVRSA